MPDLPLPTRRTALRLLAIVSLGVVAGCRRSSGPAAVPATAPSPSPLFAATPSTAPTPAPTPTVASIDPVVERAAAAERALLLAYDTAALSHPELASVLAPLRADHAAHLQGLLPDANTNSTIASSNPAPSSSPSDAVVGDLAALERAAAAARLDDLAAAGGSLARLLASIGGCEASHAALLSLLSVQP